MASPPPSAKVIEAGTRPRRLANYALTSALFIGAGVVLTLIPTSDSPVLQQRLPLLDPLTRVIVVRSLGAISLAFGLVAIVAATYRWRRTRIRITPDRIETRRQRRTIPLSAIHRVDVYTHNRGSRAQLLLLTVDDPIPPGPRDRVNNASGPFGSDGIQINLATLSKRDFQTVVATLSTHLGRQARPVPITMHGPATS